MCAGQRSRGAMAPLYGATKPSRSRPAGRDRCDILISWWAMRTHSPWRMTAQDNLRGHTLVPVECDAGGRRYSANIAAGHYLVRDAGEAPSLSSGPQFCRKRRYHWREIDGLRRLLCLSCRSFCSGVYSVVRVQQEALAGYRTRRRGARWQEQYNLRAKALACVPHPPTSWAVRT